MGIVYLFKSFIELCNFSDLFYCFLAVQAGIVFGMLPGLTATVAVAILTALTFKWDPGNALLVLISAYVGAIYGGSRTAVLLNIPGTPASAATCFDGYPLARSGRASEALGLATTSSFLGSIVGLIALAFLTPLLAEVALDFKSYEVFWLAIFGIAICGNLTSAKNPVKGWISGIMGILLSFVGMEKIWGYRRFTFNISELMAGFDIIPVLVGVYALVEILNNLIADDKVEIATSFGKVIPGLKDIAQNWWNIIRSGIIGVVIGIIPGVGENIGSYIAYDAAKRSSKTPEKFGHGSIEGLIASETANNAVVGGAMVPMLALAIPGSPPAAVLLAALYLHNVNPGPLLMIERPTYIYQFSAMFALATFAMLILGLLIVKPMLKLLRVKKQILMPIVFVLCIVGTYSINGRLFDILAMICFGALGFIMRKLEFSEAPFVLGLILGPMMDENLRRGLILSGGSVLPFFGSPICILLGVATFITLFGRTKLFILPIQAVKSIFKKGKNRV